MKAPGPALTLLAVEAVAALVFVVVALAKALLLVLGT